MFADAVGNVQFSVDEGLTGWVARHRTPEFIRDRAMDDPRMKYVPLLQEERFQSMVAVPILSRSGETIGVIVLHTEAPHEFTEDTLKLLVHIASLVSGAIENAQLYDRERRRVDALTGLSGLAQEVAAATDAGRARRASWPRGTRRLLGAEVCQLYRLERRRQPACSCSPPRRRRSARRRRSRRRGCCSRRSTAGARGRRRGRCGPSSTSATCS